MLRRSGALSTIDEGQIADSTRTDSVVAMSAVSADAPDRRAPSQHGVIEMTTGAIGMSFGMRHRFRMPDLAKPHWPAVAFRKCRWHGIGLAIALFMLLCCSTAPSHAAENLECPEIGPGRVPDLIGDAAGAGLITSENRVDLANEINGAINRLQISNPNISWSDVQDVLIAAYCRVVARASGLTAAQRWSRMRQFAGVLEQQIAADRLSPGTLLIANVPLAPDVFRELRSQAAASGQTTTQLMAAILTRAAGK